MHANTENKWPCHEITRASPSPNRSPGQIWRAQFASCLQIKECGHARKTDANSTSSLSSCLLGTFVGGFHLSSRRLLSVARYRSRGRARDEHRWYQRRRLRIRNLILECHSVCISTVTSGVATYFFSRLYAYARACLVLRRCKITGTRSPHIHSRKQLL